MTLRSTPSIAAEDRVVAQLATDRVVTLKRVDFLSAGPGVVEVDLVGEVDRAGVVDGHVRVVRPAVHATAGARAVVARVDGATAALIVVTVGAVHAVVGTAEVEEECETQQQRDQQKQKEHGTPPDVKNARGPKKAAAIGHPQCCDTN